LGIWFRSKARKLFIIIEFPVFPDHFNESLARSKLGFSAFVEPPKILSDYANAGAINSRLAAVGYGGPLVATGLYPNPVDITNVFGKICKLPVRS